MSLAGSQQKIFLRLVAALRPHWHRDAALPARIQALFAANRAFGSRDRKLYRELIYTALRFLPWIEPQLDSSPDQAVKITAWLAADLPATRHFRHALCGDWPPCPDSVAAKAAYLGLTAPLLPAWFARHCPAAALAPDLDALHTRAPLWLRLQTFEVDAVLDEFTALNWTWKRSEILASALELGTDADVTKTEAWRLGRIEVQDLGSQLILESAGVAPGGRWLDACAGAGGKTLQLAQLLGPTGQVDAYDIRPEALRELEFRARRAGIALTPASPSPAGDPAGQTPPGLGQPQRDMPDPSAMRRVPQSAASVSILPHLPESQLYDGVLVDAPCSGTGTWRRAPHLKWSTAAGQVTQAAARQRTLLDQFCPRVRPGGRLIYATCSLSHFENEDVVAAFLADHPDFTAVPPGRAFGFTPAAGGLTILPARHNTDGFFVASLVRSPDPAA